MEIIITKETVREVLKKVESKFVNKTANWKAKHWFIAGAITILITNSIFPVLSVMFTILTWFTVVILYYFGIMIGFGEEKTWGLIELLSMSEGDQTIYENPYYAEDLLTYITDFGLVLISWLGETGKKAWELLVEYFPVLLDFNLDLDFINLDFVRILRSVFSVLQFVILFIVARKFRIWLRKVIKRKINDNDYFDKQFYREVRM